MRALWKMTLEAAKEEALLAADLYNQSKRPRRLEGFFVHMHMAWLYLFIARHQRSKLPYHYKMANGRYERTKDGERKTWDVARFTRERWPENDPTRRNLELTIALRHKIEHRYAEATAIATAGYAQALLLNFERELTDDFGPEHSLGDDLRFPVFVGAFSREGAARMAAAQQGLPKAMRGFLADFQGGIDPTIRDDLRYEFRVHLIQKTGPKAQADVAMTFVRADELTADQLKALEDIGRRGTVVVREQIRDVSNADKLKPGEAAKKIESQIPFKFGIYHFARAWKALQARPPAKAEHPERTVGHLCVYDKPHGDYLYTEAFVEKVVKECGTEEGFRGLIGVTPVRKVSRLREERAS